MTVVAKRFVLSRLRESWTHVDEIIAEGARWLTDDVQSSGAVMSHHGRGAHAGGGMSVSFAPYGYLGPDREHKHDAVVIFELGHTVDLTVVPFYEFDQYRPDPFTDSEFDALAELLRFHGLHPVDSWNGPGLRTGSFRLKAETVAPSLTQTVANYHHGCPIHRSVFCYTKGCTWHDDGLLGVSIVEPKFVVVPHAVPSGPAPSIGNRNLETVLAAIARSAPVAEQLGLHAALIVPGRRGRVENDEYIDEDGLAVAVPAEVYERLIRLAALADQLGVD